MLRVDLARPFLNMAVKRNSGLNWRDRRVFNRDRDLQEAATALAIERYEAAVVNGEVAVGDEESGLLRFLQWLIDNQEEIRALIEMIMSLFNTSEGGDVL